MTTDSTVTPFAKPAGSNTTRAAMVNLRQLSGQFRGLLALADALAPHAELEGRAIELRATVSDLETKAANLNAVVAKADEQAADKLRDASARAAAEAAESERLRAAAQADRDQAKRVLSEARAAAAETIERAKADAKLAVELEVEQIKRRLSAA